MKHIIREKIAGYTAEFKRDGDTYIVSFPELPGCATFGYGLTHTKEMALEALQLWLEVIREDKKIAS